MNSTQRRGDPLTTLLDHRSASTDAAEPFNGGEHMWLGNAGAARAAARCGFGDFGPFKRARDSRALTYGEIVALSGDFYEDPDALFDETPAPLPWLWESNDLADLTAVFEKEVAWARQPVHARGTSYPDDVLALWWNAKQYVELALRNDTHFGWHNMLTYARHHQRALELAQRARTMAPSDGRSEAWRRAVFTAGFADHFLTDGFAAGHVRAPAAQIRAWAAKRGLSAKAAGMLVKLIHDQDGHVAEAHGVADHKTGAEGLRVRNARGDQWHTRCDGQLFLTTAAGSTPAPEIELPIEAVALSVAELLRVYGGGPMPEGVFAATELVAFPQPDDAGLSAKFRADDAALVDRIEAQIPWYANLPLVGARLSRDQITACFEALPSLMAELRAAVAADEVACGAWVARIAPALVSAYRTIR